MNKVIQEERGGNSTSERRLREGFLEEVLFKLK